MKSLLKFAMLVIALGQVKRAECFTATRQVEPACCEDHVALVRIEGDLHPGNSGVSGA